MVGWTRALVTGIGLATLAASGTASAQGPSPGAAAGRELFQTYCASCHGVDGRGKGPVADALETPPADLTKLSERYGTPLPREELAAFIDGRRDVAAHGPRDMPVWGKRFSNEAADAPNPERVAQEAIGRILDYLASIQRFESARALAPQQASKSEAKPWPPPTHMVTMP